MKNRYLLGTMILGCMFILWGMRGSAHSAEHGGTSVKEQGGEKVQKEESTEIKKGQETQMEGAESSAVKKPKGAEGKHHKSKKTKRSKKQGTQRAPSFVTSFGEKQIKEALTHHIQRISPKQVMILTDSDDQGKLLKLEFIKIHDPVRKMNHNVYFACTDFNLVGSPEEIYDIDFWLVPDHGRLKVTKTKVHKNPILTNGKWEKRARYTFRGDTIVPVE